MVAQFNTYQLSTLGISHLTFLDHFDSRLTETVETKTEDKWGELSMKPYMYKAMHWKICAK